MLVQLSKLGLEAALITRKKRFNKCRIANGKITAAYLLGKKKIKSIRKKTIELKPIINTSEEINTTSVEFKVVKLNSQSNSSGIVKTYNQQFKGGYFGRRKRF